MTKMTARSGWTNIRICNDCKQTIEPGDRCGCPTVTPFVKGADVTLLDDGVPFELGVVARVGNGAWRLGHRALWFRHDGSIVDPSTAAEKRYTVRLRQPQDEPAIKTNKEIIGLRDAVTFYRDSMNNRLMEAKRFADEAESYDKAAAAIVPAAWGERAAEQARGRAIGEAVKAIAYNHQEAAKVRTYAARREEAADGFDALAKVAREKLAKAKADLDAMLAALAQNPQQGSDNSGAA